MTTGGESDFTRLRRDLAGDDAQERGLARAIAADETDARSGRQRGGGVMEQRASADLAGDVVDAEHRGAIAGRRCGPQGRARNGCDSTPSAPI
jgi:hypothetical protein